MDNQFYNSDDKNASELVERRRKRALQLKKERERQLKLLKRRLIAGVVGITLVLVIIFSVVSMTKMVGRKIKSGIENNNVLEVAAGNEEQTTAEEVPKIKYKYPELSATYKEVVSDAVRIPYVALLSVEDDKIIAGRGYDTKIYPASMTKVMTLLVAVENIKDLDNSFYTYKYKELNDLYLEEASVAGFLENEKVSVTDMLYGLVLPSGADAAIGLANLVSGSETEFAKLMNKKCEELGLKHTHFVNTSGLHSENQYTTPVEMAMIMRAAMDNPICAKVLSTYQYTTKPTAQHPEGIPLTSTMFSRMYGTEVEGVTISAGKTGYVYESGHCLVSYAEKAGRHYVCVFAQGTNKWHCIFDAFEMYKNYLP